MADQNVAMEKCSRCAEALDTTGYPLWCKACRAKHQREYMALRKQMSETRGFAAGVAAMRATMVRYFRVNLGTGHFSAAEAARIIEKADGPALPVTD